MKTFYKAILKLDFCNNICGTGNCTWQGEKCFNTFRTCKDKQHYSKGTKIYEFKSSSTPEGYELQALPFLEDVSLAPTELRDDKTISARATLSLRDERDFDTGTDPYILSRPKRGAAVQGSYFRKLKARNHNYKGRLVEVYEVRIINGNVSEELKFRGKIENFEFDGDKVKISCLDLLAKLDDVKYPIRLNDIWIEESIPAMYISDGWDNMKTLQLKENDWVNRTDFAWFELTDTLIEAGSYISRDFYYTIRREFFLYQFDSQNRPIAMGTVYPENFRIDPLTIKLGFKFWQKPGVKYHILYYRKTGKYLRYEATPENEYRIKLERLEEVNKEGFIPPTVAERYYKYNGGNREDEKSWNEYFDIFRIKINKTDLLEQSGIVRIGKEIITYQNLQTERIHGSNVTEYYLYNVKRNQFGTGPEAHGIYSNLEAVFAENPQKPTGIMLRMLRYAGLTDDLIDLQAFNNFTSNYTGINVSCLPLVKESKVKELYFDLLGITGAQSWVNEAGKITIAKKTASVQIQDRIFDADIVKGSVKVDTNEDDRITRIQQSFNRTSAEASYKDAKSFSFHILSIDPGAESELEYNEEKGEEKYSVWVNQDCGEKETIFNYVKNINSETLARRRDARSLISLSLDVTKSHLLAGHYVELFTDEIQSETGESLSGQVFQIIKREQKDNKVTVTVIQSPGQTAGSYVHHEIEDFPDNLPATEFRMPGDYFVTGLKYYEPKTKKWLAGSIESVIDLYWGSVLLGWKNEFKRKDSTIRLIDGNEINVPDRKAFRNIDHYDVYVWKTSPEIIKKYPISGRRKWFPAPFVPEGQSVCGLWTKVKSIPDAHIDDENYIYQYELTGDVGDVAGVIVVASHRKINDKLAQRDI